MKLNNNIEEYDIKSLSSIVASIDLINKSSKMLSMYGEEMQKRIGVAGNVLEDVNYGRLNKCTQLFILKSRQMQSEMDELNKSVTEFVQKVEKAWSDN